MNDMLRRLTCVVRELRRYWRVCRNGVRERPDSVMLILRIWFGEQRFGLQRPVPLPTEVLVRDQNLYVVDAMNFRVQFLSRSGEFEAAVGQIGDIQGSMFRPKGIGVDSEGHLYVA